MNKKPAESYHYRYLEECLAGFNRFPGAATTPPQMLRMLCRESFLRNEAGGVVFKLPR